ncbi:SIS domain-containing protein [uncultured Pseudokineococcus sp.]|uniref:SIS domain-containing protein n=1 Tax=uncultured Pseudokineococcus sp. TaxID=1642928 RepID=UPI002624F1A9|nr:SIS domain-containing protein [uncultured Pseudokineococcus sp.]
MADLDEALLDDADRLAAADPSSVLRALAGAGAQVRRALELVDESPAARWGREDRPRAVVVAARGGATVVAGALEALAGQRAAVPVVARTGAALPAWVGALDLVVAVSLSGRAEATVALAAEAGRRGARLLTVGAAGSPLEAACAMGRGVHVPLPEPGREATSAPTSRTALWSLLTPALCVTSSLGVLAPLGDASAAEALAEVATALDAEAEACRPGSETFVNPAKALALDLAADVPVLLGDGDLAGVAARRAASVLARTARVPAVHGRLPDDAGDVVATFGGPFAAAAEDDLFDDPFAAAAEDDLFDDPFLDGPSRSRLRLVLLREGTAGASAAVLRLAERSGVRTSEVVADAGGPLARFAQLVARTDFAAAYLALATGLDPATSPHVAELRDALG